MLENKSFLCKNKPQQVEDLLEGEEQTRDRNPSGALGSLWAETNSGARRGHGRKGGPEIFPRQRKQDSVNQLKRGVKV